MARSVVSEPLNGPLMLSPRGADWPAGAPGQESTCAKLDFVESDKFQLFIGSIIGANVIVIAGETDYPDLVVWAFFDNFFLTVFFAEILLRLVHSGVVAFFARDTCWTVLDVIIVVMGILDSWIEPALVSTHVTVSRTGALVFRFVRVLRLLRMFRAVKLFPKLRAFAQALVGVFTAVVWIFTLLIIFLLCCAIVLTRELGKDGGSWEREEEWAAVRECFQDVPTSLFTLFRVSTQDGWMDIARPLISLNPAWTLFFVGFITFVSWTMISVLTAVASEYMVAATVDRKEQEIRQAEQQAKAFIDFLRDAFIKADADGNGFLDKEEFRTMMKKEFVIKEMRRMGFSMTEEEILKAWDMLDVDRCGELSITSFVSGLAYLQEKLTTRHVMSISYLLRRVSRRLEMSMMKVAEELDGLRGQNEEIVRCLRSQERLRERQQGMLMLWYKWMSRHNPKAIKDVNASQLPMLTAPEAPAAAGTAG